MLVTSPEVAGKVALLWPDETETLAGTESNALSLSSETTAVLVAAALKVTVQVVDALLPNVAGEQDTELSCAGALPVAVSEKVRDTLFKVAVKIAA